MLVLALLVGRLLFWLLLTLGSLTCSFLLIVLLQVVVDLSLILGILTLLKIAFYLLTVSSPSHGCIKTFHSMHWEILPPCIWDHVIIVDGLHADGLNSETSWE